LTTHLAENHWRKMEKNKLLALSGSAMLVLGAFMPVVSLPIVGSLNYLNNGEGDGVFIVVLGILAAALALGGQLRFVWIPGAISAVLILITLTRLLQVVNEAKASMEAELAGNPFAGLAEGLLNTVQLQWGWVFLLVGSVLVISASFVKSNAPGSELASEEA
jgi:hypothetical protein